MAATGRYVGRELTWLLARRDKVDAEIERQLLAGKSFGTPGGRSRTGMDLDKELEELQYAINSANGTVVTETIADCSGGPL